MSFLLIINYIEYLCHWIEKTLSKTHIRKKKCYAYLAVCKRRIFRNRCKNSILALKHIAWAIIVTSVLKVSYDLQTKA